MRRAIPLFAGTALIAATLIRGPAAGQEKGGSPTVRSDKSGQFRYRSDRSYRSATKSPRRKRSLGLCS